MNMLMKMYNDFKLLSEHIAKNNNFKHMLLNHDFSALQIMFTNTKVTYNYRLSNLYYFKLLMITVILHYILQFELQHGLFRFIFTSQM